MKKLFIMFSMLLICLSLVLVNTKTISLAAQMSSEEIQARAELDGEKSYQPKNTQSFQIKPAVATAVYYLFQIANRIPEQDASKQIKQAALIQAQNLNKINKALDGAALRKGAKKFILGPDYFELMKVKQGIKQDKKQIEQLINAKDKVSNNQEKAEIQKQITALQETNNQFQEELKKLTSGFSLFGGFFKIISLYFL